MHALHREALPPHPVAHTPYPLGHLLIRNNLHLHLFPRGHRQPLPLSVHHIRWPWVRHLVRLLDRIQYVQVRQCPDYTEEHYRLNRRVGCMQRKGAEHRSQHITRTINNHPPPFYSPPVRHNNKHRTITITPSRHIIVFIVNVCRSEEISYHMNRGAVHHLPILRLTSFNITLLLFPLHYFPPQLINLLRSLEHGRKREFALTNTFHFLHSSGLTDRF